MSRFILMVDGGQTRPYASRASAVRAGRRDAKSSYRVLEEHPDGSLSCVAAWDKGARQ